MARDHSWKANWRANSGSGTARNGGRSWTQEEDKRVKAHDISDRELADELGRSMQAIHIRRSRIS